MNKYAIIGLGFIYPRHKAAIERTGGQIVATCDNDPLKNADFSDWRELYTSEVFKEVDTVVICTPNYLHATLSAAALAAGKKVICEKPLALKPSDVGFLKDTMPILQLRYHPSVQKALEKGVRHIEAEIRMFRDAKYFSGWKGDFRQSGGLLFNLGIHYLDLLTLFLGKHTRIKEAKSDIVGYDDQWNEWFEAEMEHENGTSKFFIELCQQTDGPKKPSRKFTVTYLDGTQEEIELSQHENLSYEDLHIKQYEAFLAGDGLKAVDELPAIALANDLYKSNNGR